MQVIDSQQAQKVLENMKKSQRWKSILLFFGLLELTLVAMMGVLLYIFVRLPLTYEDGGQEVFIIAAATFTIGFLLTQAISMFYEAFTKNHKDLLLIYLTQRQLQADAAAEAGKDAANMTENK